MPIMKPSFISSPSCYCTATTRSSTAVFPKIFQVFISFSLFLLSILCFVFFRCRNFVFVFSNSGHPYPYSVPQIHTSVNFPVGADDSVPTTLD
ncbi:hypothetical protein BJX76DRAFT_328237 [Aspergillus varians]